MKNLIKIGMLEGFDNSYVSRLVNLTTLPDHLTLFDIAVDPPVLWEQQRGIFRLTSNEAVNLCK